MLLNDILAMFQCFLTWDADVTNQQTSKHKN